VAATEGIGDIGSALARAFPRSLASGVAAVIRIIPTASHAPVGEFHVSVEGEQLSVPYRIYNDEPGAGAVAELNVSARLVLHAIYTRHHDGHVRQRHLGHIIGSRELWVAAYVVQLIGEYVVEMVELIANRLPALGVPGSDQCAVYGRFVTENGPFLNLTAARVVSYWNEYYRHQYPQLTDYPGQSLVVDLRAAARHYTHD
jgi:hypothetical protein